MQPNDSVHHEMMRLVSLSFRLRSRIAVVLSIEEYRALAAHKPDFKAYLLGGPKVDDFSIERDCDTGRVVEL